MLTFAAFTFAQNKSVYSDLRPENCVAGDFDKSIPGLYFGICKGVGGYDLDYYLDDERNSLGVVFPSKKVVGLNFWNYFRDFSELGEKAEWRLKADKPVALIVRLNVSDREDSMKKTSYLIVSKITGDNACVTNVVKPGKNQNVTAQKLADKVSNKKCLAGFADRNPDDVSALPADIGEWAGEGSDRLVNVFNKRLKKLLGNKNYDAFMENFESLRAIEKSGSFMIGSGCMIRACTHLEAAIAVNLENNTLHAAIFNEVEETKYFNEKNSKTPEPIIEWANRLENLKNPDSQTNKPEAVLIDEFSYGNREDMMLRIDNFTNNLQNDPTAEGYVIIKGDKKSRTKAEKEIKDYLKQRQADFNRFVFLSGEGSKQALIQLWLVPEGADPPEAKESAEQKESVETKIIALEKQAWEAWKNKDTAFFQSLLAEDALSVNAGGVFDKAQILEYYGSCDVKRYSLGDFRFRLLDKNSALITFTARQDAVCGGEKNPPSTCDCVACCHSFGMFYNIRKRLPNR